MAGPYASRPRRDAEKTAAGPLVVQPVTPAPSAWDAFERLARLPFVLFLDSSAPQSPDSRFSYVAAAPFEVVTASGGSVEVSAPVTEQIVETRRRAVATLRGDPLAVLAERLSLHRAPRIPELPPFQGGAGGVFGYGLGRSLEDVPAPRRDEFGAPDLAVALYDWVLAFDHARGTCHLIAHGLPHTEPTRRAERARRRCREVLALLDAAACRPAALSADTGARLPGDRLGPSWPLSRIDGLRSNFSRVDYLEAVGRAIEYVRAGDIFQVNMAQRLVFPQRLPSVEIYRMLRAANPAPFSGFFAMDRHVLASTSCEHFLGLEGGRVYTRPIKGTRPRGRSRREDEHNLERLLASEKDRSENIMIVDLLRNDLSRVARPGTVRVPRLLYTETHPTVHHLVSEITAELREGTGPIDLVRATFPGGSITGAPKVRAMEIIAELEPHARGLYCGSFGWIALDGSMRLNILIRTATLGRGWIQIPVGGGIVADSDPESEYRETLDKAEGMLRALAG